MSQRRTLVGNAAALYALQAANYLFPLLTVPFLLRVLGLDGYGAIAYAASGVHLAAALTEFGFSYTATRRAAAATGDLDALGKLWGSVTVIRTALALVALVPLAAWILLVPDARESWALVAVQLPIVAGQILFPTWLFQGVQRMTSITVLNVLSRTVTIAVLFALVREPEDTVLAAGIQASHYVLSGALAWLVVRRVLKIRLSVPRRRDAIVPLFKESADVFLGTASGHVYIRGPILIIGSLASAAAAGSFAVVQQIGGLVAQAVTPLTQALYPHMCNLVANGERASLLRLRRRLIAVALVALAVGCVALYALAGSIVTVLAGEELPETTTLLRLYLPVIVLITLNVLLTPFAMAESLFAHVRRFLLVGAAVFLVTAPPLIYFLGAEGAVASLVLVEAYILVRIEALTRRGLNPGATPAN